MVRASRDEGRRIFRQDAAVAVRAAKRSGIKENDRRLYCRTHILSLVREPHRPTAAPRDIERMINEWRLKVFGEHRNTSHKRRREYGINSRSVGHEIDGQEVLFTPVPIGEKWMIIPR